MLLFVLFNSDMMINLYQLYFQPNKKKNLFLYFFILPTKRKWEKLKFFLFFHFSIISLFSILLIFHPPNQTEPKSIWVRKRIGEKHPKKKGHFLNIKKKNGNGNFRSRWLLSYGMQIQVPKIGIVISIGLAQKWETIKKV